VEEVVPSVDPATRTILVKVGLPEQEDVFPGMFGRLLLPVREREVVLIPKKALRKIGQLEVVTVSTERPVGAGFCDHRQGDRREDRNTVRFGRQ
jgi:HlyD family secretion protein